MAKRPFYQLITVQTHNYTENKYMHRYIPAAVYAIKASSVNYKCKTCCPEIAKMHACMPIGF